MRGQALLEREHARGARFGEETHLKLPALRPLARHLPDGNTSPFLKRRLPLPVRVCPSGLPTAGGALTLDVRDLAGDAGARGEGARAVDEAEVGVDGAGSTLPAVEGTSAGGGTTWKLVDLGTAGTAADEGDVVPAVAVAETDLDRLPARGPNASNGDLKLNGDGLGLGCDGCSGWAWAGVDAPSAVDGWSAGSTVGAGSDWGSMRRAIDSDGGGEGDVKPVLAWPGVTVPLDRCCCC